ncbi:toprim domain-containing protein [Paraferrimonas haliotis]|uniref:toprim domain-containing protein n=1 Tax=Paraferrimonas haliotis TaxID=2013866 RepID=UPI000BA96E21|nr:toprim domain-containing protein [Paraferrimonas haliotis]
MHTALDIISYFREDFITAANEVGIDGTQLLSNLPPPGIMLKGKHVPVLEQKYQGTCSVLFFINMTRSGQEYPFVRFHTFKHGGITTQFNGLKYVSNNKSSLKFRGSSSISAIRINQMYSLATKEDENRARLQRYRAIQKQYFLANELQLSHPWVQHRLAGYATNALLSRLDIKSTFNGDLYAPLQNAEHGNVGYHKIFTRNRKDHKRHLILKSGRLNGSYIEIKGAKAGKIAICEGLVTGLTIALVWAGPIYVALTANNLKYVRESISHHTKSFVYFFADNDQWKPHAGNTGIEKAKLAMLKGDHLLAPEFSATSLIACPTDYNDLLVLEGLYELEKQVQQFAAIQRSNILNL